ncbi:MAG: hypothetical protein KKD28_11650, partial [Chloroflexi bacterium]|nr:hypothetical protein [Chloroflexota bacterium]
ADIEKFLNDLVIWYTAISVPGSLNHYPYALSLRDDLLLGSTTGAGLLDHPFCETRVITITEPFTDTVTALACSFMTTLDMRRADDQPIFSPNIWGNRIAGVGEPLAESQGIRINLVTTQPAQEIGQLEVLLIHDGKTTYRGPDGMTVAYDLGPAAPVGYVIPDAFTPNDTTIVLRPSVNGQGEAIPNRGLMNLSVAASNWTVLIFDDSDGGLDHTQLQDIEIFMDTTGRAMPGSEQAAERDAERLQAGLPLEAPANKPSVSPTQIQALAVAQPFLPSAPSGKIGGTYSGDVLVTYPVTAALQVLDLDLLYSGTLFSGTITGSVRESALYPPGVGYQGITAGDFFTITSDVITNVIHGKVISQQFTLVGHGEFSGDKIVADYTSVITGLLPEPIVTQGFYTGFRMRIAAADFLLLEAAKETVLLGSSVPITVSLFDFLGDPVSGMVDLSAIGGIVEQVAVMVNGQAVITFKADTLGLATIIGTTGVMTDIVSVNVIPGLQVYLPVLFNNYSSYQMLYENDFSSGAGPEWSPSRTDVSPSGEAFLGQFGNEEVLFTITNVPVGQDVNIAFDLYILRSWDGSVVVPPSRSVTGVGPDLWMIGLKGEQPILNTTFNNWVGGTQAYPDAYPGGEHPARTSAEFVNGLGYTFMGTPMDSVYHLSFTVPAASNTLVFSFGANGLQALEDESWGVDNIEVWVGSK